jgi:hypothetical protein
MPAEKDGMRIAIVLFLPGGQVKLENPKLAMERGGTG